MLPCAGCTEGVCILCKADGALQSCKQELHAKGERLPQWRYGLPLESCVEQLLT